MTPSWLRLRVGLQRYPPEGTPKPPHLADCPTALCRAVSMTPAATRSRPLAAALAIVALALTGCASTDGAATQTTSTSPPANAEQVIFEAELTSDYSKTYAVGASDSKVFGVNILAGNTKMLTGRMFALRYWERLTTRQVAVRLGVSWPCSGPMAVFLARNSRVRPPRTQTPKPPALTPN